MVRVAIAQLNSNDEIKSNLNQLLELIDQACTHDKALDLIVFPENTLFFRMNSSIFYKLFVIIINN